MEAIRRKAGSESGASILLALLLVLVCLTVGASVLTAAVSDAGINRDNRREQQAYLALSSALRLVTEELTQTEYRGCYTYAETAGGGEDPLLHTYMQKEGRLTAGGEDSDFADCLLPDLDALFAASLKAQEAVTRPDGAENRAVCLSGLRSLTGGALPEQVWEITPDLPELAGYTVRLHLQLSADYRIELWAELSEVPDSYGNGAESGFVIRAELVPSSDAPEPGESPEAGDHESAPMTWQLGWIAGPQEE